MYLYTKRGTYHKGNGLKSGDVVYGVDDGTLAVLTLADGVSSCAYGDIGARLITSMAIKYVHNQYSRLGFLPNGNSDVEFHPERCKTYCIIGKATI